MRRIKQELSKRQNELEGAQKESASSREELDRASRKLKVLVKNQEEQPANATLGFEQSYQY